MLLDDPASVIRIKEDHLPLILMMDVGASGSNRHPKIDMFFYIKFLWPYRSPSPSLILAIAFTVTTLSINKVCPMSIYSDLGQLIKKIIINRYPLFEHHLQQCIRSFTLPTNSVPVLARISMKNLSDEKVV